MQYDFQEVIVSRNWFEFVCFLDATSCRFAFLVLCLVGFKMWHLQLK